MSGTRLAPVKGGSRDCRNRQQHRYPRLRRNVLDLPQVVFQGITHIAPSINIVFTFPIIALKAGPAMPISFLLTTIVCFFIGNTVSQFSKYMPSSGGYYSFATRGLGDRGGFMTTWSYLIYDIIGPAGAIGFLGYLLSNTIQQASGVDIPWWIFALATFGIVWVLTHFGIRLSMRTTVIFGAIEMLIMLALAITFLVHPGPGSSYVAPLQPSNAPHGFGGVLAGMVFSVLALSGFEAPAPLAQETRRPGKFIGRAVMVSLFAIGGFYIFTSYASAIGWGTGNMASFASSANPYYVLGHALWGAGWWFVVIAIINSAIGVGLACTNAASRVMYTMGQAGTLPPQFGRLNRQVPHPDVRDRVHPAFRDRRDPARRPAAGPRGHLRVPRYRHHARRDRPVRHGEPGADRLHPPGAPERLQHLAARGAAVDRHAGPAAGAVRDRLPAAALAVQHHARTSSSLSLIVGFGYMQWRESPPPGRAAPRRLGTGRPPDRRAG